MIRVMLADDHPVVRQGIHVLLQEEPDLEVVGAVDNGVEAVKLAQRLRPDVLVVDMVMEDISGIEVAKRVAEGSPGVAVVILSMFGTDTYVRSAMQAGARGYILKKAPGRELVAGIRKVASGGRYLSEDLRERAVSFYLQEPRPAHEGFCALSGREREVLRMVLEGLTSAKIAKMLVVSRRTVEFHRANTMRKLEVRNQNELLRHCIRIGLMTPGPDGGAPEI